MRPAHERLTGLSPSWTRLKRKLRGYTSGGRSFRRGQRSKAQFFGVRLNRGTWPRWREAGPGRIFRDWKALGFALRRPGIFRQPELLRKKRRAGTRGDKAPEPGQLEWWW